MAKWVCGDCGHVGHPEYLHTNEERCGRCLSRNVTENGKSLKTFSTNDIEMAEHEAMKHAYPTSKNYERLWLLAKTQRVVCFIDGDVCQTQALLPKEDELRISSRGRVYIEAYPYKGKSGRDDFLFQCEMSNLEFIDPESMKDGEQNCTVLDKKFYQGYSAGWNAYASDGKSPNEIHKLFVQKESK